MNCTESLREIYDRYEEKLNKVNEEASPFAGAFHFGDDPKNNACHEVFYEEVEQWTDAFLKSGPSASEAAEAAEWILDAAGQRKNQDSYWYMYAAQKHACGLIPLLSPEDAGRIRENFCSSYPKLDWNPVQKDVNRLLLKTAGEQEAGKSTWKTGDLSVWIRRVAALLTGLTIAHLGVTLFLLADLGSDPFNVMIQGLFRVISQSGAGVLSHGTVHMGISFGIILALLAIDRSYVRIGTFLCMVLGGPIIDLFTLLLQHAVNNHSPMVLRLAAVVLGCGILAFGMTIVIKSQAGTGPNDLVAVVISDKTGWKFGIVRIAADLMFAGIGFLLGGTVGIGTLVCVAVVGPVAQIFMPFSQMLCRKVFGVEGE